jgi:hypothetical protein
MRLRMMKMTPRMTSTTPVTSVPRFDSFMSHLRVKTNYRIFF